MEARTTKTKGTATKGGGAATLLIYIYVKIAQQARLRVVGTLQLLAISAPILNLSTIQRSSAQSNLLHDSKIENQDLRRFIPYSSCRQATISSVLSAEITKDNVGFTKNYRI